MEDRILAIVNQKEANNCIGKEVSKFDASDGDLLLTFHDGSTLEIKSGIFENQLLYLNKGK